MASRETHREHIVCADPAVTDAETVTAFLQAVEYALICGLPAWFAPILCRNFEVGERLTLPISPQIVHST